MSSPQAIVIREINDLDEMREIEKMQKEVWGVNDLDVYPALALRPQVAVGAILIGAFSNEQLAGFVFGFPGIQDKKTIIHSDMLAVKPEFRSLGLGYLLKLSQRERALEMGINRITWTYDPLQLRNANLNIGRLGVIVDRYEVNFYGETSSFLHSFGTDRLWVSWLLDSKRVKERIDAGRETGSSPKDLDEIQRLVRVGDDQHPVTQLDGDLAKQVVIEIPGDINQLAAQEDGSARRWREATRRAFTRAMNAGYFVEDFFVIEREEESRAGCYLLASWTK